MILLQLFIKVVGGDTDLIFLHLRGHHAEELSELDHPIAILVKLIDEVLKRFYDEDHKDDKTWSSSSVGFSPSFFMTPPSSAMLMFPLPSTSYSRNAFMLTMMPMIRTMMMMTIPSSAMSWRMSIRGIFLGKGQAQKLRKKGPFSGAQSVWGYIKCILEQKASLYKVIFVNCIAWDIVTVSKYIILLNSLSFPLWFYNCLHLYLDISLLSISSCLFVVFYLQLGQIDVQLSQFSPAKIIFKTLNWYYV